MRFSSRTLRARRRTIRSWRASSSKLKAGPSTISASESRKEAARASMKLGALPSTISIAMAYQPGVQYKRCEAEREHGQRQHDPDHERPEHDGEQRHQARCEQGGPEAGAPRIRAGAGPRPRTRPRPRPRAAGRALRSRSSAELFPARSPLSPHAAQTYREVGFPPDGLLRRPLRADLPAARAVRAVDLQRRARARLRRLDRPGARLLPAAVDDAGLRGLLVLGHRTVSRASSGSS